MTITIEPVVGYLAYSGTMHCAKCSLAYTTSYDLPVRESDPLQYDVPSCSDCGMLATEWLPTDRLLCDTCGAHATHFTEQRNDDGNRKTICTYCEQHYDEARESLQDASWGYGITSSVLWNKAEKIPLE